MNTEAIVQTALRLLPAIVITGLGFVAAADQKTRARWADLLYQAGSLRPEQRQNPQVQRGVRVPFFVVVAVFLVWPVLYYRYATRVIEVRPDFFTGKPVSPLLKAAPNAAPATANTATANTASNNAASSAASNTSIPNTSIPNTSIPNTSIPNTTSAPAPASSAPLFSVTPTPVKPTPAAP